MGKKEQALRRRVELMLSELLHDYGETDGIKVKYVEQMLMDVLQDTSRDKQKYYDLIRDVRIKDYDRAIIPPPKDCK